MPAPAAEAFWSRTADQLAAELGCGKAGLSSAEAGARLRRFGPNAIAGEGELSVLRLMVKQFESPLVLILVVGAGVSLLLREWVDAGIILAIVTGSGLLGFLQEFRASRAVIELRRRLALKTRVVRDGSPLSVPLAAIVPGDLVVLSAGNLVPADALVLEAGDFLVTEASLTGESFPVEKRSGLVAVDAPLAARTNAVFMGSSVRSGTARVLVAATGASTAYGEIAGRLEAAEPETDFARGVRHFGAMLVKVMTIITLAVFAANQLLGRPIAESLLFSVALAVGLSPELLPAIVAVTLSAGARELARGGVIVRRLEAIENLGSMDVLCTDKTGTLTTGEIVLEAALGPDGRDSGAAMRLAFLNAAFETGIVNPLDAAILAAAEAKGLAVGAASKLDEIPYDFSRRRLTIVVEEDASRLLICKGAFADVLGACTTIHRPDGDSRLDAEERSRLETLFRAKSEAGFRVLALAVKTVPPKEDYDRGDEAELAFSGFLLFTDPAKPTAAGTLEALRKLGIALKVISGDNRYVTAHLARAVGLDPGAMLTGAVVAAMSDEALAHRASRADLFVEIDPQQKERIVRALQRGGHAVGYMGDGINDAPALHAADVGISVDGAVDVARESADIVLLRPDLGVLCRGVVDGRTTFANTLKYISITTSANFGNMVSMALVTPFLPFLPLLPKQILLNNFLSDVPSAAISSDRVDPEQTLTPQRWDVGAIRRFMIVFGLVSSVFDLLTFAVLIWVLEAAPDLFRTIWFLVSLLTELGVVLVLRTHRPAFGSRPSALLLWSSFAVATGTLALPFVGGVSRLFGFIAVPAGALLIAVAIVVAYLAATEAAKQLFYRLYRSGPGERRR